MVEETTSVPVVVVGLGAVGRALARAVLDHEDLELVGAADPALAGRGLAEVLEDRRAPAGYVAAGAEELYRRAEGGVALVATVPRLEAAAPTLLEAARAGLSVISTCEELAYPYLAHPELADRLERAFRKAGTCCLGTGVNPGFVLDRLPAFLGGVLGRVRHVSGRRTVDLATRRPALQARLGLGLDPEAFAEAAEQGEVGHVGLAESVALVAEGLDLDFDEVDEILDPVIAETPLEGAGRRIAAGEVSGVVQLARAFHEGRELVRLELEMALGRAGRDELRLDADPPVHVILEGGLAGEAAVVQAVLNAVPQVLEAEPGLLTVLDLPAGR